MNTSKYSAKSARIGTTPKHILDKQKKAGRTFADEYAQLASAIEKQEAAWRLEAYEHYELVIVDELTGKGNGPDAGDVYKQTARHKYGSAEYAVTKAQRQAAKINNYLSEYGSRHSGEKLQRNLMERAFNVPNAMRMRY